MFDGLSLLLFCFCSGNSTNTSFISFNREWAIANLAQKCFQMDCKKVGLRGRVEKKQKSQSANGVAQREKMEMLKWKHTAWLEHGVVCSFNLGPIFLPVCCVWMCVCTWRKLQQLIHLLRKQRERRPVGGRLDCCGGHCQAGIFGIPVKLDKRYSPDRVWMNSYASLTVCVNGLCPPVPKYGGLFYVSSISFCSILNLWWPQCLCSFTFIWP